MKGFRLIGEYTFEFITVTLLMLVSIALILPFPAMVVGLTGFFQNDINTRRFKDIFTTIGKNIKILIPYTFFELILLIFSALNIYFFNTHPGQINAFILVISYLTLFLGAIYLVHAPVVIVNMKLTFMQLIYNGIMLIFGYWWRSILAVGIVAGIIALVIFYPYAVPATLYFLPLGIAKLLNESFLKLKAKALKTTVAQLKESKQKDDYINEYGEVDHSDEVSDEQAQASEITENNGESE